MLHLTQCTVDGFLGFAIYQDGVTPGNNMRPDSGRRFFSWMWTIRELPRWMTEIEWNLLAYIRKDYMDASNLTIPIIARASIRDMFLHSERNLQNPGIRLQHGDRWFTLRMKFAFNPQDFAAHEDMYDLKGSSGLAPCPCCDNCMGRRGFFDDDGPIAHVYSWKYNKFKSKTPERAANIVNNLRDLADTPGELDTLEKATGIKYNPNGILFDREVSIIMNFPNCVYIDLTHALFGSGGIARYHINGLVYKVVQSSQITVEDIDKFSASVTVCGSSPQLPKTFFQDRVQEKPDADIKSFASETMTAIRVFGLFLEMVVKSMGLLVRECAAFQLLIDLSDVIVAGTNPQKALELCRAHHEAFMEFYSGCAKPKLHYVFEAIMAWLRFKILFMTCSAERQHQHPKQLMNHCYKHCTQTAMAYWLRDRVAVVREAETFQAYRLAGTGFKRVSQAVSLEAFGGACRIIANCNSLRTPKGTFSKKDLSIGEALLALQKSSSKYLTSGVAADSQEYSSNMPSRGAMSGHLPA